MGTSMHEHSLEEIDNLKRYLTRKQYDFFQQSIRGRNIEYWVASQKENPSLPDFVYRATNSNLENYVLMVSDSVPEKLRPYFILAEYIEFKEKDINQKNRVIESEKEVLKMIPNELKKEYIKRKLALYKKDLQNNKENPKKYLLNEEDIEEFNKAIDFLGPFKF